MDALRRIVAFNLTLALLKHGLNIWRLVPCLIVPTGHLGRKSSPPCGIQACHPSVKVWCEPTANRMLM